MSTNKVNPEMNLKDHPLMTYEYFKCLPQKECPAKKNLKKALTANLATKNISG
jgi:hypothetical protein